MLDFAPATLADIVPASIRDLLGQPPIIASESETLYWAMVGSLAELVKARNPLTWFRIKDVVDARIEIQRWRMFKVELINDDGRTPPGSSTDLQIDAIFEKMREIGGSGHYELPDDIRKEMEAGQKIQEALDRRPKTSRELALMLKAWIEPVSQLDHLQTAAERRYQAAIEELLAVGNFAREDRVIEGEIVETSATRMNDRAHRQVAAGSKSLRQRPRGRTRRRRAA